MLHMYSKPAWYNTHAFSNTLFSHDKRSNSFYVSDRLIYFRPQLRERLALLKIAEKEDEEEKRDAILKSKVVSVSGEQ